MRRIALALAVVAVVAASLWFATRRGGTTNAPPPPPAAPAFAYAMADGLRRDLQLSLASEGTVDLSLVSGDPSLPPQGQPGGQAALRSSLDGRLALKLFADGEPGWTVAALLVAPELAAGGKRPAWAWQLATPFLFRLGPDGRTSGAAFPPGMGEEPRAMLVQLVSALQVVPPPAGAEAWTSEETDGRGSLRVAYALRTPGAAGAITVDRRLVAIAPRPSGGSQSPVLQGSGFQVEASAGEASVAAATWIEPVTASETVAMVSGGKPLARTTSRFSARSVEPGADPFPATLSAFRSRMRSQEFVARFFRATDPELDRIGAPLGVDGALAHYLSLRGKDKRAAEAFLVNYLRQKPGMALSLLRIVDRDRRGDRLDEHTQLVLWRLVVEAGTPEAQGAVASALRDPSWSRTSHVRALLYAVDFTNPEPALADALWALHRDPPRGGDRPPPAATENMSILAVGGVGWREHVNEETRAAVATSLSANLVEARERPVELAATLQAIGNTGNGELVEAVRPWLGATEESVRVAACDALRRMTGPEAQVLLTRSAEGDPASRVREEALRTLGQMEIDPATVAWARARLGQASDPRELTLLVEILGGSLQRFPANAEALRALLASNPPPLVKEALYRYVAPAP